MKKLFIYIDPGFIETAGHYSTVAAGLRQALDEEGIECWHFVNNDVSNAAVRTQKLERLFIHKAILREIDHKFITTVPAWKLRIFAALKSVLDPVRAYIKKRKIHLPVAYPQTLENRALSKTEEDRKLDAFRVALESIGNRLIAKGYEDRQISIFMYTGHPLYFPIFAEVFSGPKYAGFQISIHLNLFYLNAEFCRDEASDVYKSLLRTNASMLEWRDQDGRIRLYADSDRTIRAYRKYYKRTIGLLPVPVNGTSPVETKPESHRTGEITIGFFGYPSRKQGYHFVKRLYDSLLGRQGLENIRFVIRHNELFPGPDIGDLVISFRRATNRITHLHGYLTPEEYRKALGDCDIVLVPHSRREYPTQTSGLFVEAVGAGKVVIAPKDTWMADQLRSFGSGVTFDSDNFESFESAVLEAIRNLPNLAASAARGSEEFRRINSAENLLAIIEKNEVATIAAPAESRNGDGIESVEDAPASSFRKLKNMHRGQRCFVVGNGPSLNRMNLELLAQEYVFCTNAFFLMFPKISWRPQYFTAVDTRVVPDRAAEIVRMHEENPDMTLFFPKELIDHQTGKATATTDLIPQGRNRHYFSQHFPTDADLPYSAFSFNPEEHLVQPYTVTVTALQLAAYLGFDPIYLIGCDTEYSVPGSVRQEGEVTAQGKMFYTSTEDDDLNHFDPSYFGKGKKWHNPQVDNMIWHYRMAHEALAILGRRVLNAGVGGRLEEFPRVQFERVLG